MEIFKLGSIGGTELLNKIANLPSRGQQLFFGLIENSILDESKESLKILEELYNYSSLDYSDCKSPIEQIFALAYDMVIINEGFPANELLVIYPQEELLANGHKYRADFLFDTEKYKENYFEHPYKLVIECDGHRFHEKTKEQVVKNNQRDLDLKMNGYDVLHFSGSQIYKDPIKCAYEACVYIESKVGEIYL